MPYTKKDYPDSLKNFDEATRMKAIDIINAMIADGYEEGRAIPIGIAKAKEWKESASSEEKKEIKSKDVTKHKESKDSSADLVDANVIVEYREDEKKWAVMSEGAKRADSLHDTKKEAEKRAKEMNEHRDGKVEVKNK